MIVPEDAHRSTQLNGTELTRFRFWRTDLRASRSSPLIIGCLTRTCA